MLDWVGSRLRGSLVLAALTCALVGVVRAPGRAAPAGLSDILAASPAADWRAVDPEDTLYLILPQGRVVIELAPAFAPGHVANIKRLVRAGFYDGLAVVRVQDDYVVQWGDAASPVIIRARGSCACRRSSIVHMGPRTPSFRSPTLTPMRRLPALPTTSRRRGTRPRA